MKKIGLERAIQIALEYYQLKQYKQVTEILQPLIQHGIQDDGIYLLVGNAYYCLGAISTGGSGVFRRDTSTRGFGRFAC